MRLSLIGAPLMLAASAVAAALARQPAKKAPKPNAQMQCPMCRQMMSGRPSTPGTPGGMIGGGMMNPQMMQQMMAACMQQMQQTMGPTTVTVAGDGTVYVMRGGTLLKYDANLNLLAQTSLPGAAPVKPGPADKEHQRHH